MQTKMFEKAPNSSDLATRALAQWTGSDRLLKFAPHSFFLELLQLVCYTASSLAFFYFSYWLL